MNRPVQNGASRARDSAGAPRPFAGATHPARQLPEKKRFVLVNIPTASDAYHSFRRFSCLQPPIGLATIAALLERDGYAVHIVDADAEDLSLDQTLDQVVEHRPHYVGSTTWTATMDITYDFYTRLKQRVSDVIVVVGGPHSSSLPEQTLRECESIDIVVIAEGDVTISELMAALETNTDLGRVAGLAYRDRFTGRIVETPQRPLAESLDFIPIPAYHLLNFDLYHAYGWNGWVSGHRRPIGIVFTGRGCFAKCNFCASNQVFGRGMRYFPMQHIRDEIDLLVNKYGIRILYFQDDTFTANRKVVNEICDYLIDMGYNRRLEIMCSSRCDTVHPETMRKMRQAGVRWICFGVESGDQAILDRMRKGITLENIRRSYALTRGAGLYILGNYMIGHLGETRESAMATINLACESKQEYAAFSTAIPFPGTELYEHVLAKGIQLPPWREFGSVNSPPIALNDSLDAQALMDLRRLAVRRFFGRPSYIAHMLWRLNGVAVARDFFTMYVAMRREKRAGRF